MHSNLTSSARKEMSGVSLWPSRLDTFCVQRRLPSLYVFSASDEPGIDCGRLAPQDAIVF